MKLKTLIASTMLAGALVGCGGGSTGGNEGVEYTPYPDAPEISASDKQAFLDAVNEERESGRYCGNVWYPAVPALKWDDHLYTAAYEHSHDMAVTNEYTAHNGTGTENDWTAQVLDLGRGSTTQERSKNNGILGGMGENVAAGYVDLADVMDGWLDSDGHCRNIMDSRVRTFGMALVKNDESTYKTYWTQTFN